MRVRWSREDTEPMDEMGLKEGPIIEIRSTSNDQVCQVDKTMVNGEGVVIWITPR